MEGILEIKKLEQDGLVIEQEDDFQNSVFKHVYKKAALLIGKIIRNNLEMLSASTDHSDNSHKKIDNIIAFEGRRGTGKTSAMISVHKELEKYNAGARHFFSENVSRELATGIERADFTVLDYIDASLLEKKEGILRVVLANMFTKLNSYDSAENRSRESRYGYDRRELYRLFDDVYGTLNNLKNTGEFDEVSPIRGLKQMSNSNILGKQIQNLVRVFLEYVNQDPHRLYQEPKEHYLVITIDDIDMAFGDKTDYPFELLETIHRYLMIPRVIILLTFNLSDLSVGCQKHFYEIYKHTSIHVLEDNPKYRIVTDDSEKEEKRYLEKARSEKEEHVQALAAEYLNKILPKYNQIHMPSLRKRDYESSDGIQIAFTKKDVENLLSPFNDLLFKNEENECRLSVKKFIFLLKASVAGLYYDAAGAKRHFIESPGLRDLAQTFSFYKQLQEMNNDGQSRRDLIFKEILDELYFHYVIEKLSYYEREEFKKYLELSIERRSIDILANLNAPSVIEYKGVLEKSYSYGELLYGLHHASQNGIISKQMVWCILDSYTIMLTQLYYQMTASEEKQNKYKERLLHIIGSSIAGGWSNELLPLLQLKQHANEAEEMQEMRELDLRIELTHSELAAVGAIKFTLSIPHWEYHLGPLPSETSLSSFAFEEKLGRHIQRLEILGMFFTDVSHRGSQAEKIDGFQVKYHQGKLIPGADTIDDDNLENPYFEISFSDGCFNILNFVKNLFDGTEYFMRIRSYFFESMKRYIADLVKKYGWDLHLPEYVNALWDTYSLQKDYQIWAEKTRGLAMPFYSFDMMYNIFKHQAQQQGVLVAAANIDMFWLHMRRLYADIGERLKEQDQFYFSGNGNKEEAPHFFESYQTCPFISYINQINPDPESASAKDFSKCLVENMLLSLAQTW